MKIVVEIAKRLAMLVTMKNELINETENQTITSGNRAVA